MSQPWNDPQKHPVPGCIVLLLVAVLGFTLLAAGGTKAAAAPAEPAACVIHHNYTSTTNWSSSNTITIWSNTGWSRLLWAWDSCGGGYEVVFSFDPDCHLVARWYAVNSSGTVYGSAYHTFTRGAGCVARPGKLTFQGNGAVKTWSGAGTQLSATPTNPYSPYMWQVGTDGSTTGESTYASYGSGGSLLPVWYGPRG